MGASGGAVESPFYPPLVAWGAFQPRVISPPARLFRKTVGAILYENFGMGYFEVIGEMEYAEWTYARVGEETGWTDRA